MAATETAKQLKDDVTSLMDSYTRLLKLCYAALAPEATARQRKEVRDALQTYLERSDDKKLEEKPND